MITDCKRHVDGLDGTLVGRGWYGPTLAGTRTGAPLLALEGRRTADGGTQWLSPIASALQGAQSVCVRAAK